MTGDKALKQKTARMRIFNITEETYNSAERLIESYAKREHLTWVKAVEIMKLTPNLEQASERLKELKETQQAEGGQNV